MELILFIGLICFAAWIIWFRKHSISKSKENETAIPAQWGELLEQKVKFYRDLTEQQKEDFKIRLQKFLQNVNIRGVDTEVTEADRLLIASSAIIPIFAFPDWEYQNLNEVLLYPNSFSGDFATSGEGRDVAGMVGWGAMHRTMIISRQSLQQGFANEHSKSNVGIHEFVHLIDKMDGATDGIPEVLLHRQYAIPWMDLVRKEIQEIKDKASNINPYGATNQAEFFSVASEYFFMQPKMLKRKEPELYEMLERIFRQDPAE